MKQSILLIFAVLLMTSCKSGDKQQTVTIENRYSLTLPGFLKETDDLHEDASLQYENEWKEFYVTVLDESKAEMQEALEEYELEDEYPNDVNGYSKLVIEDMEESIVVAKKTSLEGTTINGLPAKITTITGNVDGVDVFYYIAIIEGKETFYNVMAWTLANRENTYKGEMKDILYSFKEL